MVSCGCTNSSSPSESDGLKIIERLINERSNGRLKLINIKKTNGIPRDLMGMHLYVMECECLVEVLSDCYISCCIGDKRSFVTCEKGWSDCEKYKKGMHLKVPASIDFEKTENGWRESP